MRRLRELLDDELREVVRRGDGERGLDAACGLHARDDLGLCARDVLARLEMHEVAHADVGDGGEHGTRGARHPIDLAEAVHAHLEHEGLRVCGGIEQREGHADEVVVVARRGVRAIPCGERGGKHVLRGGLSHGARHAGDDPIRMEGALVGGQAQEELLAIVALCAQERATVVARIGYGLLAGGVGEHDGRRAGLEGLERIEVAVAPLPLECHEQGSRCGLAGIDDRLARDDRIGADQELCSRLHSHLMCREGFHRGAPYQIAGWTPISLRASSMMVAKRYDDEALAR